MPEQLVNPISYRVLPKAVNTGSGELARIGPPRVNKLHAIRSLLNSFSLFCLIDSVLETLTEI